MHFTARRAWGTRVVNLTNNAWRRGWSLIKTLPIQDPRLTKFHVFRIHRYLDRVFQPRSMKLVGTRFATVFRRKAPCGSLFLWIVSKSRATAYILVLADSRLLQESEEMRKVARTAVFHRVILAHLHDLSHYFLLETCDMKRDDRGSRGGRPKGR